MLNFDLFHAEKKSTLNIVLVHGLFGDKDNLTLLRKQLQPFYNVMTVDLPNHGASPHIDNWSFELVVDMIHTTLEQHQFTPDCMVGHSLGGKVAMSYALLRPNVLRSAVIADIAPASYEARHNTVFQALNAVDAQPISQRADAGKILASVLQDKGTQQFLLKSFKKGRNGWAWQFNLKGLEADYQNLSGWPFTEHTTTTKMLFVKGQNSDYLNTGHTEAVNRHFSDVQVKVIADTGHWLHAEKPVIFNRIVTQFLQQSLA